MFVDSRLLAIGCAVITVAGLVACPPLTATLSCEADADCPPQDRCMDALCVPRTAPGDGGAQDDDDAGVVVDAGAITDAGVSTDAGETDAGALDDAGAFDDAGPSLDAGVQPDAGTDVDAGVPAGWFDPSFHSRWPLTITGSAGDHVDFPVLLRLDMEAVDAGLFQPGGADVAIVLEGQLLDHEVETWDADGESLLWVRLPTYGPGDRTAWLYGERGAAFAGASAVGVWQNGYDAVYHLAASAKDSAARLPEGDLQGSEDAAGLVGRARRTQSGGVRLGSGVLPLLQGAGAATVSMWIQPQSHPETFSMALSIAIADADPNTNTSRLYVAILDGGRFDTGTRAPDGGNLVIRTSDSALGVGASAWIASRVDYVAGQVDFFLDGTPAMSTAAVTVGPATSTGGSATAAIGASDNGSQEQFDGVIDEVRISSVRRSDAWIAAENVAVRGELISVGARESY